MGGESEMSSIYELIFACFVTAALVIGVVQLIDYERQRKFDKELKRREARQDFEKQMDEIRSTWGGQHFGEVRMTVKRNRKKDRVA